MSRKTVVMFYAIFISLLLITTHGQLINVRNNNTSFYGQHLKREDSLFSSYISSDEVIERNISLNSSNKTSNYSHTGNTSSTSSFDVYLNLLNLMTSWDSRLRPLVSQSDAMTVYIDVHFAILSEVDEVAQTIAFSTWVNFTWFDQLRLWEPTQHGGIRSLSLASDEIWHPKGITPLAVGDIEAFKSHHTPFFLYYNGRTVWLPVLAAEVNCIMDFRYFPFDTQTCSVSIIFNNPMEELNIIETLDGEYNLSYTTNGEWDIVSKTITSQRFTWRESAANVDMTLVLKRRPHFVVTNLIVPMATLSLLMSLVFVLPADGGERASFATSLQLALVLYMGYIADILPKKTDGFPLLIAYLFTLICLSAYGTVAAVANLKWLHWKQSARGKNHVKQDDKENDIVKNSEISLRKTISHKVQCSDRGVATEQDNEFTQDGITFLKVSVNADLLLLLSYILIWFGINVSFFVAMYRN